MRMHPRSACLMAVLCPVFLAGNPGAQAIGNPYQAIVDRNVFALKDPPPPPPPGANDKPVGPPITLTGITTILGTKRAFMNFTLAAKPPEPAKPMSLMLTEGQRDGDVEVIQIDEKAGSVKVNAFGENRTLTFSTNSTKSGGIAQMGAPAGGFSAGGHTFTPGGAGAEQKSIPTRMMRIPGAPGSPSPGGTQAPGNGVPGNPTGVSFVPGQTMTTPPNTDPTAYNGPVGSDRSPEENVLLYEANRLKNEQLRAAGVNLPKLPQHPYLNGVDGSGQQPPNSQTPGFRLPYAPTVHPLPAGQ